MSEHNEHAVATRPLQGTLALLSFAAGSLARRSTKAFALGGALALTVAAFASVLFLTDALRAAAERVRDGAPDIVVQRLVAGRPVTVDVQSAAQLRGIDAVKAARPRVWGYVFVPAVQANVVVVGSNETAPALDVRGGTLAEGRFVERAGEACIGAGLARALGLRVGDDLLLPLASSRPAPPLKVVGTFAAPAEVYTSDLVLVRVESAREMLGLRNDEATDIAVDLTNVAEARVVARAIGDKMQDARIVDRALVARVHELAFGRRSGLAFAAILPALLALLVLGWDRLSGLSVEERRELAILKAVGFATRDVLFVRMAESLVVALVGTALGLALAYVWIFVLGAPGLRDAIAGFGALQGETPLVPMVDAAQLFGILLGVVAPFVGASVLPAWRAATSDPLEGMRD